MPKIPSIDFGVNNNFSPKSLIRLQGKIPAELSGWQKYCNEPRENVPEHSGNFGVPCGPANGIIVLDQDNAELFNAFCDDEIPDIPVTYTVKSGRANGGGRHLYFRYPNDGKKYRKRAFKANGFELIASGGYVVAPGGVHPDSGHLYVVVKDIPVAQCPEWIKTLCLHEEEKDPPLNDTPDAEWWDGKIESLPVPDRIKNLIAGTQGGEDRSADMMAVINHLAYCELSDSQIYQIFAENPIGDKSREKNDPEKWLKSQIDNGRGYAAAELGFYTTPQEDFGTPVFTEDATIEWEDPIPLGVPAPPAFTSEDFPEPLWGMIDAVSKALEVPTELPGLLALGVVAASVQKKMVVSPEPGYVEPLNIFCNVVLPPGERKSGALKILTSPLIAWEIHQSSIFGFLIKEAVITKANHDARITSLRGRYAKEKDPAKREALQNEMLLLAQDTPNIPVAPQLWTQDCTPERLGSLLSDNGEKMAVLSAEGGIFDIISGRYSNGTPNLDVFLQGHAGDSVRVDRAGRDAIWLKEPALTMILSTQPDVLQSMADKRGFRGRGLVARFLYAVPSSAVGKRCLKACPVPQEVDFRYQTVISSLLNMTPLQDPVQFEKEAHTIWKAFAIEIEHELAEGGRFEHMRDWAGKLPGAAVRIAGLYHSIKIAGGLSIDAPIDTATMKQALSLSRKLMPHVESAYALMGANVEIDEAGKVLAWIKRQGASEFSLRECHRALAHIFLKREDLDPAIEILIERGHIRKLTPKKTPGRQSLKHLVNPKVFS